MDRAGDARARGAPAARVGVSGGRLNGTRTIERLRHGDSGRALRGRRRTGENQAGRERATVNRPREQAEQSPMTRDVAERHVLHPVLASCAAGTDEIRHHGKPEDQCGSPTSSVC